MTGSDDIQARRSTLGPVTADGAVRETLWLTDSEQAVWRHLLGVESRLTDRLDVELREAHGITLAEYGVLVHLSESGPYGMRMSELAERLLLSRSGLTRRIDSMVRAGLVARRSCPADGRGAMAQLTEQGHGKLAEAAPTHVAGVRRYLIDALAGDLTGLSAGLGRIDDALDEAGAKKGGADCGTARASTALGGTGGGVSGKRSVQPG